MLEKILESFLDCKEIKPVISNGNQPCIFTGRTNAEAEAPILWPPDVKSLLIGKDLDAGKDWRQEEKRTTEDEVVGWRHWLNGHEFEWTVGVGDVQGGLACCSPWVAKSRTQPNDWTELNWWFVARLCYEKPYIFGNYFFKVTLRKQFYARSGMTNIRLNFNVKGETV